MNFYRTRFIVDIISEKPLTYSFSPTMIEELLDQERTVVESVTTVLLPEVTNKEVVDLVDDSNDLVTLGLDEYGEQL